MSKPASKTEAAKPDSFPYGRDSQYVDRNIQAAHQYGLGVLRQNVHNGVLGVLDQMPKPEQGRASSVMRSMLGGSTPKWEWESRGGSRYSGENQRVYLSPTDYAQYGFAVPLHESIHALQSSAATAPGMLANKERVGEDTYRFARELAPTVGTVVATAQANRPSTASDIHWDLGNYHPNVEYLRSQAERHGVFNGESIDKLISENPQFMQLLARQSPQSPPPPLSPAETQVARRDLPSIPEIQVSNEMSQPTPSPLGWNVLNPTQNMNRTTNPNRTAYGVGAPRAYSPTPVPAVSQPVAPQVAATPSPAMSPRVAQSRPPLNAAYNSVNLPATEYGANQSTQPVRERIANRFDPTSWATYTRTPSEIQSQIGARTQAHLGALRERNFDPNNSRGGYQYSPVNGAGIANLAKQEQASREQQLANYRQFGLQRDARIAQDPTAQARWGAMNGVDAGAINPAQYQQQLGQATAQYNTYARATRLQGGSPISFDTFLSQFGNPSQMSPEVQQGLQDGRELNRSIAAAQEAQRQSRGPSLQFAQYMNQRFGLPMAMPSNPQAAQQWQNSLAMQGNPYAMQTNLLAQQGQAALLKDQAQQMADLQKTMMEQAGQNARTQMQYAPKPVTLNPQEQSQVITEWTRNNPEAKQREAYLGHIREAQASGLWDANGGVHRNKIMAEATEKGAQAASAATEARRMLASNPVFGPVVSGGAAQPSQYGLGQPMPEPAQQPQMSQGSPFWLGGQQVTAPNAASLAANQTITSATPQAMYGINPTADLPAAPPPMNATSEDMFNAYSALRRVNGGEPTFDQVKTYLAERNLAVPEPGENSGELRPFYQYSHYAAEGQKQSPNHYPYLNWLNSNKQKLGAEPPSDPHSQYAPGNWSGF